MKKIVSLICAMLLLALGTFAQAESAELSAMTDAELEQLIDGALAELNAYIPALSTGDVLYEDESIRLTLGEEFIIDEYGDLCMDIDIENFTNYDLYISVEQMIVNGWTVDSLGLSVNAGMKNHDTLYVLGMSKTTGLTDSAEIDDIRCILAYYDEETYDTIATSEPITWRFSAGDEAYAGSVDLSAMDQEALTGIIADARLELYGRLPEISGGIVLYEDESITITVCEMPYIDDYGDLALNVAVMNRTDYDVSVCLEEVAVNGWEVFAGSTSVNSNGIAKNTIWIFDVADDADVATIADLQEITCRIAYYDVYTYDAIHESEVMTWVFNQQ